MKLNGPDKYTLTILNRSVKVMSIDGTSHFVAPSTSNKKPKLYVVSKAGNLLYIGITRQSMSNRFRGGMTADGAHGYHGYLWGKENHTIHMDIWYLGNEASAVDLETIEAEVVYLYRNKSGKWPLSQTEIHFHQSGQWHRECAEKILKVLIR
jgi:hypothetical protein